MFQSISQQRLIWIPTIWIKILIKIWYDYEIFWNLAQGRLHGLNLAPTLPFVLDTFTNRIFLFISSESDTACSSYLNFIGQIFMQKIILESFKHSEYSCEWRRNSDLTALESVKLNLFFLPGLFPPFITLFALLIIRVLVNIFYMADYCWVTSQAWRTNLFRLMMVKDSFTQRKTAMVSLH